MVLEIRVIVTLGVGWGVAWRRCQRDSWSVRFLNCVLVMETFSL